MFEAAPLALSRSGSRRGREEGGGGESATLSARRRQGGAAAAEGSVRRRRGRRVPREAALSGSFPTITQSRTREANGPPPPDRPWAQIANLSKTPSSGVPHLPFRGCQVRHLSPLPSASTTVAKTVEERGGGDPQHNQTKAKKNFFKQIPSETYSINQRGKPPKQANLQLQPRSPRAGGGAGGRRRPPPAAPGLQQV